MKYSNDIKDAPGLALWGVSECKNKYDAYKTLVQSREFSATMYIHPQSHGNLDITLQFSGSLYPRFGRTQILKSHVKTFSETIESINNEISMTLVHSL